MTKGLIEMGGAEGLAYEPRPEYRQHEPTALRSVLVELVGCIPQQVGISTDGQAALHKSNVIVKVV